MSEGLELVYSYMKYNILSKVTKLALFGEDLAAHKDDQGNFLFLLEWHHNFLYGYRESKAHRALLTHFIFKYIL